MYSKVKTVFIRDIQEKEYITKTTGILFKKEDKDLWKTAEYLLNREGIKFTQIIDIRYWCHVIRYI